MGLNWCKTEFIVLWDNLGLFGLCLFWCYLVGVCFGLSWLF